MEIDLSGKRALVTGAAQGIGLAIVQKLVACGAKVVATDVNEQLLKEAVHKLPGVETLKVDVSDWNSTLEALKDIGTVELAVNNAGILHKALCRNLQEEDVNRLLDVNLKGVMAVCKHVVNNLISSDLGGAIVNIASESATRAQPGIPVYCASKAAVVHYTRCLALECAPKGIRVNAVSPGLVRTAMTEASIAKPEAAAMLQKMIPMKEKISEPEDIANAVAFLLCDKVAGRITGINLDVDAGMSLT